MRKTKIAILGSGSHIAKGLIHNFLQSQEASLYLYTRSKRRVGGFLRTLGKSFAGDCVVREGYGDFVKSSYDVLINCVGTGVLNKPQRNYSEWFTVTEEYDNLVIGYLRNKPSALYISFSSGAVYGRGFLSPAEEDTVNSIAVNRIRTEDYYAIAKLNSEAKHRAFKQLRIVDLRLFAYLSRFIDLASGYFITDLLDCIINNKVFLTGKANIVRDYVHPQDLFSIVRKCMAAGKINTAFDVISAKPAKKKEILAYFSSAYGLKYKLSRSLDYASPTGEKNIYYSKYNKALKIGYKPRYSSMDALKQESEYILNKLKR